MKSHRLRLARRGLPLTRPPGRARWRPTLRIQRANNFPSNSAHGHWFLLHFADADMLAIPLEIHLANALLGLRRVTRTSSSDGPSACLGQVFGIALTGWTRDPAACVFLWTQVDAALSTTVGRCSRSSCRLRSKRCSRPSEMGHTRSG